IHQIASQPLIVNLASGPGFDSIQIEAAEGLIIAGPVTGGDIGLITDGGTLAVNANITCLDFLGLTNNGSGLFSGDITQNPTAFVSTFGLILTNNNGNIGTPGANIRTDATRLTFTSSNGNVYVTDTTPVQVQASIGNTVRLTGAGIDLKG